MKALISLSVFILGTWMVTGQISGVVEKFALPAGLSESSGAIFFNNRLITHNDSGGENKLYELDTISGLVTRTVTITNATNVDWEDITQDNTYIYVGDIGNNVSGNRTDLKIYKINKNDYLNSATVTAQTIAFSYSDQTDFSPKTANTTEWDAESLISFDTNDLILFTKNWTNGITKGYLIPKTAGTYSVSPLATTLNSGGLVTGATYNPLTGKLYLVGYTNTLQPFVWESKGFSGNNVFSGTNAKTMLSSLGFEQTEAIAFVDQSRYFITSESFSQGFVSDYAKAIAFSTNETSLSVDDNKVIDPIVLYPNPINHVLHISNDIQTVEIYDARTLLVYKGHAKQINMDNFSSGIYMVKVSLKNNGFIIKKMIKQ